jgi:hypothetical protein
MSESESKHESEWPARGVSPEPLDVPRPEESLNIYGYDPRFWPDWSSAGPGSDRTPGDSLDPERGLYALLLICRQGGAGPPVL